MITYKGRVVYEREKHLMTQKDATRIMNSLTKDQSPRELARTLWGIDVEMVELRVLNEEDILAFAQEFLALIIRWIGIGAAWLWDFFISLIGLGPEEESPEEGETTDA